MKIYFVRHGQTDWNIQHRLQGSADIPLNKTGINQAQILKEKINNLDIDFIISSPLKRAVDTANIINSDKHLPLSIPSNKDLLSIKLDNCNYEIYEKNER